jgi:Secretion system C-terminal sorting domain
MKALLTIFLLAAALSKSAAQIPAHFAPIGTRWEYNFFSYLTEYGKYVCESMGDSIINGTIHRVIKLTRRTSPCDYAGCVFSTASWNRYYTVRNDSLLALQDGVHVFIFNFGYRVGDSLSLSVNGRINPNKAVVSRIADTVINNKILKFWETRQNCPTATPSLRVQKVYQLIGLLDGFYELFDRCPIFDTFSTLCSIKSGDWSYNPQVCRYSVATTDMPTIKVNVYPNPVANQLTVDYSMDNVVVQTYVAIRDILGKTVYFQKLIVSNNSINIDLAGVTTGIYILSIQSEGKTMFTKRIVKAY